MVTSYAQPSYPLGDAPLTEDLLGYDPYASAIAALISDSLTPTPYCVGIYGPWGTGKTTFMTMVEGYLSIPPEQAVWFEPWLFDKKEDIWKALIYTVIEHLQKVARDSGTKADEQQKKLFNLCKGLGRIAANAALTHLSGDTVDLDKLAEAYAVAERDTTQFVNTFRSEFETLKGELFERGNAPEPRLVIFIDDLDRCAPEASITVLEAIKLFFDLRGCIFVIGVDREVVQRGIEVKYGETVKISGHDYLEKLIQLPFHLPPIQASSFEGFLQHITADYSFDSNTLSLLTTASQRNPRRAKRLATCLHLLLDVSERMRSSNMSDPSWSKSPPLDEQKLATLLVLQVQFPVPYLWLNRVPVTLRELSDGPASTDLRQRLRAELDISYGERQAQIIAKEFFDFLENEYLAGHLADFDSREEMELYMQVSGVIDVTRPMPLTRTLGDSLDAKLIPTGDDAASPPLERDRKTLSDDPVAVAAEPDEIEILEKQVSSLKSEWDVLARLNPVQYLGRPLRDYSVQLDEVAERCRNLQFVTNIDPRAAATAVEASRVRDMQSAIRVIRPSDLARSFRNIGLTIASVATIVCAFCVLVAVDPVLLFHTAKSASSARIWFIVLTALSGAIVISALRIALWGSARVRLRTVATAFDA